MNGYFIVQNWNQNRTIWRAEVTPEQLAHAVQMRETIIDIVGRRYYDITLKTWVPIYHH